MKPITTLVATAALLATTSGVAMAQIDSGIGAGGDVGIDTGIDTGVGDNDGAIGADMDTGVGVDAGLDDNTDVGVDAGLDDTTGIGDDTIGSNILNYSEIVSSLETSSATIADIEGAGSGVDIVTTSELRGGAGDNVRALDQLLQDNADAIGGLTTAIEANADLSAELEAQGYTASNVVATTTGTDGRLILVVDDAQ